MPISILFLALALFPAEAFASGGLVHAEHWEMNRDGAWIINFLLLFSGLYWIIVKYGIPGLKLRSRDIQLSIDEAEAMREKSAKALGDIERKLKDFETESVRIRNGAAAEGEKIKTKIIAEAREQSRRILRKAQDEIQAEIATAKARLKQETIDLALGLARRALENNVKKDDHRKMVREYLDGIGKER